MADETETEENWFVLLNPTDLPLRQQLGILSIVLLGAMPFFVSNLMVLKLTGALYLAMFAMTWDFTSGYTGEISFGHAFFFAIGGYTSAVLTTKFAINPLVTIPIGVVLAAVGGLLLGGPALRLEGPYLSLITLTAPLILLKIFIVFSDIFGGEVGIIGVPSLVVDPLSNYYLALIVFVFILLLFFFITRSDAGRVFISIREDEEAVVAAGLNPAKFKLFSFILSAAMGGLAGALFVHSNVGTATPSNLVTLTVNITIIAATVIGGMGTIVGAAVGGLSFFMLRDYLSNVNAIIPGLGITVSHVDLILFYSLAVLVMFFLPQGLLPYLIHRGQDLLAEVGNRSGGAAATDGGELTRSERDGQVSTPLEQTVEKFRDAMNHIGRGGDRR